MEQDNREKCEAVDDAVVEFQPDLVLYSITTAAPAMQHESKTGTPAVPYCLSGYGFDRLVNVRGDPPRPILVATSAVLEASTKEELLGNPVVQTGVWRLEDPVPDADLDA